MKFNELLLEYKRDITKNNYGSKLLTKFLTLETNYPHPSTTLINMLYRGNPQVGVSTLVTGKPEQIKKIVAENRDEIINSILEILEQSDPTPNKQYTQWLIRMYIRDDNREILEDVSSSISDDLKDFIRLNNLRLLASPYNDINTYKTFDELMMVMASYRSLYADKLREKPVNIKDAKHRVYYEDDSIKVIIPENQSASIKFGQYVNADGKYDETQRTRWCTAATKSTNYFEQYNVDGELYIIFPKMPIYSGEKYQLHPASGELTDPTNAWVDPANILQKRFPEFGEKLLTDKPELKNWVWMLQRSTVKSVLAATIKCAKTALKVYAQEFDPPETIIDMIEPVLDEALSINNAQLIQNMKDFEKEFLTEFFSIRAMADFVRYVVPPQEYDDQDEYKPHDPLEFLEFVNVTPLTENYTENDVYLRYHESPYRIIHKILVDGFFVAAIARK
jgi:hypothetical protein